MILLIPFVVAIVGSVAQSVVGFGVALFLAPVMFLLLDPAEAVVATLIAATILSVLMLVVEGRRLALDRAVNLGLLAPMAPGAAAGALILGVVEKGVLQIAVGVLAFAAVAIRSLARRRSAAPSRPFAYGHEVLPVGFVAGVLNASISTGGPPMAIWLQTMDTSADQVRHTLATAFLALNALAIASVIAFDGIDLSGRFVAVLAAAVAGVPIGYLLGVRLLAGIDRASFARLVFGMIALLAAVSVAGGVIDLA